MTGTDGEVLLNTRFRAMGTDVEVLVLDGAEDLGDRAAVAIEPVAACADGAPAERLAGTDDQVAAAILEARIIAGAFIRLGRDSRPAFAWRCEKVGVALRDALESHFPELR